MVRQSTARPRVPPVPRRVFWFASLPRPANRGLSFDPELLYLGAMFHDLGLNTQFPRQWPAIRGRQRRRSPPFPPSPRRARGQHSPGMDGHRPAHHARDPRVHGTRGRTGHGRVEYDVLGIGYHDITEADRAEITTLRGRTLSAASSRRSPKAWRPSRKRRSAPSMRTSSSVSSPASSTPTLWTLSRARTGPIEGLASGRVQAAVGPGHLGWPTNRSSYLWARCGYGISSRCST